MSPAAEIEGDPSVCYRHPDRASWTLCERCGRTICPECQILTPQGVRCPECVREQGGSVQWTPVATVQRTADARVAKARREREASARAARRPRWQRVILDFVKPGSRIPIVTWTIAVVSIVLWILGFFTSNLPIILLSASVTHAEWIWTYLTAPFVSPSLLSVQIIFLFLIRMIFLLLIAPAIERVMSRARFISVFFAGSAAGSALMVLAGSGNYGLSAGLFALWASYAVSVWSTPAIRNQILIVLGINVLFTVVLAPAYIPALLGGLAGGVAAGLLFRVFDGRARASAGTPYLLLFAGVGILVVLAVVRGVVSFGV